VSSALGEFRRTTVALLHVREPRKSEKKKKFCRAEGRGGSRGLSSRNEGIMVKSRQSRVRGPERKKKKHREKRGSYLFIEGVNAEILVVVKKEWTFTEPRVSCIKERSGLALYEKAWPRRKRPLSQSGKKTEDCFRSV